MLSAVRSKLEAAGHIREFHRERPFTDPSEAGVASRFAELLGTADALAVEEDEGRRDSGAATLALKSAKADARSLLRLVNRVADVASREVPELTGKFEPPRAKASHASIRTRGRAMLDLARANLETLSSHGLEAGKLDQLDAALGRFEAGIERAGIARRTHVGAKARLLAVAAELMELARLLDSLNRARFKTDEKALAAWDSARNVVSRRRKSTPSEPAPSPTPTPTTPSSPPAERPA